MYAVHIVICRPLMRKLLELRAEKLAGELDKLEQQPLGPRETLRSRKGKMEKMCKRVKEASGKKLGGTTGPFDEDGKCFDNKAYGDLLRFVGRRCFGILNWGSHIARTEHITGIHTDAVQKGMSVDHPDVVQLGRLAGHGEDTQERFYDAMRTRLSGFFVRSHAGLLQTCRTLSSPPSTEIPSTDKGENFV